MGFTSLVTDAILVNFPLLFKLELIGIWKSSRYGNAWNKANNLKKTIYLLYETPANALHIIKHPPPSGNKWAIHSLTGSCPP